VSEYNDCPEIIVLLPKINAAQIIMKLKENGYAARVVSDVPEAFDALRSERFSFAITTRSNIDIIRNIRAIPVINLEIYFHHNRANSAQVHFDSRAFLDRVQFLTTSAPRLGEVTRHLREPRRAAGTPRPEAAPFLRRLLEGLRSNV
jgi:hypothetical protein